MATLTSAARRGLPARRVRGGARFAGAPTSSCRYGSAVDEARRPAEPERHAGTGREVALRAELHAVPEPVGGLPRTCARSTFHPVARRDGGPTARRRRRAALARPGALQGGGRARDRSAPGPALLADRRDRHDHRVDPLRRLDARERRHGLPARAATASVCASSWTSSPATAGRRTRWPGASSRGSSRCSSRCPPARWPSTTASPSTWPGRTRPIRVRRVHTAIYFADGSTRGEGRFPHPSVERAGIAMGAVIASDVTPIAWPRPDGQPPPPPADPIA